MKIAVIGTGYVGLTTGTCFAQLGHDVTCMDNNAEKVAVMESGQSPIYEPGLDEIMKDNIQAGRLHFTTNLEEAISGCAVIFLALPTPEREDGSANLDFMLDVAGQLGPIISNSMVIVNKSTVPPGTAKLVREAVSKGVKPGVSFDIVSNPEFLAEGDAINGFMKPDRIVIGSSSENAREAMHRLYDGLVKNGHPIIDCEPVDAEMGKYASNAALGARVSVNNEIANICKAVGANYDQVRSIMASDSRIGSRFLYASSGYGGSCFPKDIQSLIHIAKQFGLEAEVLRAVESRNDKQKLVVADNVLRYFDNEVKGLTFALWGLSFKPKTDDIRESAALEMVSKLTKAGARVVAYDPRGMDNAKVHFKDNKNITFAKGQFKAVENADALLIATEWDIFGNPDNLPKIKSLLKRPLIFDGRDVFKPEEVDAAGLRYESIGRPVRGD